MLVCARGYVCECDCVLCAKGQKPKRKGRLGGRRERREPDSAKRGKAALLAVLLDEREVKKEEQVKDFASECHSLEGLSSLLLLLLLLWRTDGI